VRDMLQRFLSREGFRVVTAPGGEAGLELARELHPDAITLDVLMPGMDGWAVLAALKADPDLAEIPVIMLTIVDDRNMGYALGASEYLTKPVDRERLVSVLHRYGDAPSPGRVLVVEDEAATRELLRRVLEAEGWTVAEAENGRAALERVAEQRPDLILLDLMMPDMDGWETYDNIRQMTDVPVIVVSADTKKENVVRGLNNGFDDYVTKPFFPPELVARVNTVLRRAGGSQQVTKRMYPEIDMTVDFETHEVTLRGRDVHLSSREFALLEVLARKAPRLVRYEEIATTIWDKDSYKVRNRIKYLIYLLRQKIEIDPNDPKLVINREGIGYQLDTQQDIA